MVLTLSPGTRHSPHYYFHSALRDILWAENLFQPYGATPEAKRKLSETVVWLWRHFDDDHEAGQFLNEIFQKTLRKESPLTVGDIPPLHIWLKDLRASAAKDNDSAGYLAAIDQALAALNALPSP